MDELGKLKKENERLMDELSRIKSGNIQYLQNVAHQLTAPLGAIKWSIEALKDDRVPIGRKRILLSSVYSQATILVHTIKNFALMSNLEVDHELGQFREKPEPCDMMLLTINIVNDFQPQANEAEKKIDIDNGSFRTIFGSKKLNIEKNLVSQAISNIIENAVKYASSGTTIRISAYADDTTLGVSFQSIGIPITDGDKKHLFDRGYRGQSAKQKVPAGTGFGLYIASRVMTFHGGEITVENEGKMSKFVFHFPKSRSGRA